MSAPVVVPPAGASSAEGASCGCTRDAWPYILFGLGLGANVMVGVSGVMEIIGGETVGIILNVYLIIFSVFGVAAELRMFKSIRGLMYYIVKYVYFLAKPWGKAFFYIFVGSLTWTPDFKFFNMLAACLIGSVAVLIVLIDLAIGLPMYIDTELQATLQGTARNIAVDQAKAEARREISRI